MLLPYPVGEAAARHQHDQHRRVENQHAAGYDRGQPEHDQNDRDCDRAQADRKHDALKIGQAGETPQPSIEPERQENTGLQRQHPGQRLQHVGELGLVQLEIVSKPVEADPGQRRGNDIVAKGKPCSPVSAYFH